MANLKPPKTSASGDFKCPPPNLYDCVIVSVEEVPNTFYNPEEDHDGKKTQLQWDAKIADGEFKGTNLRFWTSSYLSRHPKAKLAPLLSMLDSEFSIDVGYTDVADMQAAVMYSPVRIMTNVRTVTKDVDGEKKEVQYPKVESWIASAMSKSEVNKDDFVPKADAPSVEVLTDDIPF